ncbi:hypothetical protein AALP_AA8G243800 [Arabis alpina]|uniref:Transcription factor CBF/NF-Y/archaeal histone domain-containing protein n=1 Tax=Arabis alpina TaxID=50452 RepID=A0A087G949_ARAAL|nr:hypothetical protein AALP_AA8G243800 [Arabis alpina]
MKKKLSTRFPATRIKKIMQTDEDVGKIAMAVPLLVSKALELFLQDLCNHTYDVTVSRGAKTVNSVHLKQCVHAFNVFDFLKDTVAKVPDLGGSEGEEQSATKRRKLVDESSCNDEYMMKATQMHEVKHTGVSRGRRGRGRGRGSGRTRSSVQSLKFEDDVEDGSPESSRSPSFENDVKTECFEEQNNHRTNSKVIRNFDLNVGLEGLDENEDYKEGSRAWPFLGMNEMKTDPYQQGSSIGNEEDYDEESLDEK